MSTPRHAASRRRAVVRTSALMSAPLLLGGALVATLPGTAHLSVASAAAVLEHPATTLTAVSTTTTDRSVSTAQAVTAATSTTAVAATQLSTTGAGAASSASWPAPTVRVSTESQLVAAIGAAKPGTVIGLNSGTYSGVLTIKTSGTAASRIVVRPVDNANVTITANLPMPACSATGPDSNRTIKFMKGASYWSFYGLNIRGGVMISSGNSQYVQKWFSSKIRAKDWQARRAVPGRSTNDPTAGRTALTYLSKQIGRTVVPSKGLTFVGNTFTLKGIHARAAQWGVIKDNTITGIACGTGPAIWLATFTDFWHLYNNDISRVAHSTASHFMEEGIRLGNSSAYNIISRNNVHDLAPTGRAFTTDQDSSFNLIQYNTANNVYIGFNDEMAGWGNRWLHDTVTNYAKAGFSLRMMDGRLSSPSMNTSTNKVIVRCNSATGSRDFQAGGMMNATIASNQFNDVRLSKNLLRYFTAQHNTWNGSATPPSATPAGSLAGC